MADDQLIEGKALPIAQACLRLAGKELTAHSTPDATHVSYDLPLPAGPKQLEAMFPEASGAPLLGALCLSRTPLNQYRRARNAKMARKISCGLGAFSTRSHALIHRRSIKLFYE